jgi:SAM-dependent methyltransferase
MGPILSSSEFPALSMVTAEQRSQAVLRHIQELPLPRHPRVLEVGSGSGNLSILLASRGYSVESIGIVQSMRQLTRVVAAQSFPAPSSKETYATRRTDPLISLPFESEAFDLVLALEVLPRLPSMEPLVQELARILRPGGFAIANVESRPTFRRALDPVTWVQTGREELVRMFGNSASAVRSCRRGRFDRVIQSAGMVKWSGETLSPQLQPADPPVAVQRWRERMRNGLMRVGLLRTPPSLLSGNQYLVVARKQDRCQLTPALA